MIFVYTWEFCQSFSMFSRAHGNPVDLAGQLLDTFLYASPFLQYNTQRRLISESSIIRLILKITVK